VIERSGRIRVIRDGVLLAAPFLDITPEVSTAGEGGLLGLAFHPNYAANGRFFVSFTGGLRAGPRLRQYHVSASPDLADPTSGLDVLAHFGFNSSTHTHYGSDIHFGPDGMLYYSLGGGGSVLEQRLTSYSGKLLRIDVDIPPPHVPIDNPYAAGHGGALPLIWARGFRNPWRFSFDQLTGDLYIGDVGGSDREEIDFQPASSGFPGSTAYQGGRNYGFPCMEGSLCHSAWICPCDPSGATLVLPAFEWATSITGCVIGGFVYRGSAIPGMQGRYFCADMTQRKIWTLVMVNGHATGIQDMSDQLRVGHPDGPGSIVSFGEDAAGELYMTCANAFGSVFRIDPAMQTCVVPVTYCGVNPNSTGYDTTMYWSGSASIARDELVLIAAQAPPRAAGRFLCGTQEIQQPLGNGWRCVGGNVVRLPYLRADAHGEAAQQLDYSLISVSPAQTRDFQFIYRDSAGGGSGFNLSNGLRVVFCP
jgi:glucose/arabinose dehydrogenase